MLRLYSRADFINISALKSGVYSRAAFIQGRISLIFLLLKAAFIQWMALNRINIVLAPIIIDYVIDEIS